MGSKYVTTLTHSSTSLPSSLPYLCSVRSTPKITSTNTFIVTHRTFLAKSRLILARIVWAFELSLDDREDKNWLDNRAYLAYEPKALMVNLREKSL